MSGGMRCAAACAFAAAGALAHAADPSVGLELARIDAEYEAASERCDDAAGQAKDLCLVEARAERRIRKAELAARGQGTIKAWYDARVARAEAEFAVAKERCTVRSGAEREACVADARALEARAKAEAHRARSDAEAREVAGGRAGTPPK